MTRILMKRVSESVGIIRFVQSSTYECLKHRVGLHNLVFQRTLVALLLVLLGGRTDLREVRLCESVAISEMKFVANTLANAQAM